MSGPKIIDVAATRAQERMRIEAICRAIEALLGRHPQLAQVDRSLTQGFREAATAATGVLELMDITGRANQQLAFVRSEAQRARALELTRRGTERSAQQTMARLIEDLRERHAGNAAITEKLDAARASDDPAVALTLYDEARGLADAGSESGEMTEIRAWLRQFGADDLAGPEPVPAPEIVKWRQELEVIRMELNGLEDAGWTQRFAAQAAQIEAETDPARRRLWLDSLRFEFAETLAGARERQLREDRIAEWREALGGFAFVDRAAWETRWTAALTSSAADFQQLTEEVAQALEAAIHLASARAARGAILEALRELGYELVNGMESAFVEDGKVVIRKPEDDLFGIELSTFPQGDPALVKAAVVRTRGAEAATPDARQADREREEAWCQDSEAMRHALAAQGIQSTIKTARPAGHSAVAAVHLEATAASATLERRSQRAAEAESS